MTESGLASARFFHANVNCSALDSALPFWSNALGMTAATHTAPDADQDGAAFGLDRARWEAWILLGSGGIDSGVVDLLEWRTPAPVGAQAPGMLDAGYSRLGVFVPDLDAVATRVSAYGTLVSAPRVDTLAEFGTMKSAFATDPDGTVVELVEGEGPKLAFVAVTARDRDASQAFYDRLGFTVVTRFSVETGDGAHLGIDGPVAMDALLMMPPGGGAVALELVRFRTPAIAAGPPRPANALGIWRCAYLLDDVDAAYAELAALDVSTLSPVVTMAMGPGLPELRFVCFPGPDGEIVELIESPR